MQVDTDDLPVLVNFTHRGLHRTEQAFRRPGGSGRYGPSREAPQSDGVPDPGEIVWTWVPFEENDGRGKDRPVLVVAVESAGTYLAVQLTSKDHDGEGDFVSVGAGGWDGEHRPSWVNLDRVIRVQEGGMRRESTALPRGPFEQVTDRLHQRYGWR